MEVHKPETRAKNMSAIRDRDILPKLVVRKALHRAGCRYRVNTKDISGTPDLVFPKFSSLVFMNGCFWHGHDCYMFKWPKTRRIFWRQKISLTIQNDHKNKQILQWN